jgi:type IV secretory pathway TrbF-like protein
MAFLKQKNKAEPRIGSVNETPTKNPFIGEEGRREWSDRYGNMARIIRGWQGAFGAAMVAVIVLTGVNAKLSMQTHIQPFAVELNQGVPIAIKPMSQMNLNDTQIVHFFLEHFIENARTVVSDVDAEKNLLNSVYAFAADQTLPFLKEYYVLNNPLKRAQTMTVNVHVIHLLPLSDKVCQVMWEETARNVMNGDEISKTRWIANITYQKTGKVDAKTAKDNPFGLYITNLTWSQSQEGEKI